eukprot:3544519-Prymnesium_polylepis.1
MQAACQIGPACPSGPIRRGRGRRLLRPSLRCCLHNVSPRASTRRLQTPCRRLPRDPRNDRATREPTALTAYRGRVCLESCGCSGCLNHENSADAREKRAGAIQHVVSKTPFDFARKASTNTVHTRCTCNRSGCTKGYCVFFQAGVKCTELCKCTGCGNCDAHTERHDAQTERELAAATPASAAVGDEQLTLAQDCDREGEADGAAADGIAADGAAADGTAADGAAVAAGVVDATEATEDERAVDFFEVPKVCGLWGCMLSRTHGGLCEVPLWPPRGRKRKALSTYNTEPAPAAAVRSSGATSAPALGNLAANAEDEVTIAPLVALLCDGSADAKEQAAGALKNLAVNADDQVKILKVGAVAPLVAVLREGSMIAKEQAAEALKNLAANNAEDQVKIVRAGAVAPL